MNTLLFIVPMIALLITLLSAQTGWNNIFSAARNELVFDGRNKVYGAYALRRGYNRNLAFAGLISLGLAGLVSFSPAFFKGTDSIPDLNIPNVISDFTLPPIKTERVIIPPRQEVTRPPGAPRSRQTQFTSLEVLDEPLSDPPPAADMLWGQQIGLTDGEGPDELLAPVILDTGPVDIGFPEDTIFSFATRDAEYPGGEAALRKDMVDGLRYPAREKGMGIQGEVLVAFVVEVDGTLSNAQIVREVEGAKGFNQEVLRAVYTLKRFRPAEMNGRKVRKRMVMPVEFRLRG